jgi:DNA-binding SARP family transcriptional activator
MEYRVLGPVEVLADGRPVVIGGPKPRSLLVLLLLNAGRVVPTTQVIEALWGGRPPMSGATRVQGVVSQLLVYTTTNPISPPAYSFSNAAAYRTNQRLLARLS